MLVDPELAARARELLREPDETGGKGEHMSALGTHVVTSGTSLGLEPPLSPPVVRSPMASAMPTGDGLAGLPTPPPAIRPPESAAPAPAPIPHAELPVQPAPAPAPAQPEPAPAAPAAEAGIPAMPPAEEPEAPVLDYFAGEAHASPAPEPSQAPEPVPAEPAAPVDQPAAVTQQPEPTPVVQVTTIPPMAPAPAEEQPVELAPVAPPEPEQPPAAAVEPTPEPQPADLPMMAPQPVELAAIEAELATAPAAEPVEAALPALEPVEAELPAVEPVEEALPAFEPVAVVETAPAPEPAPELEELFAGTPQQIAFSVVVRLKDGDGVVVGSFRDFGTAMEGAQEVIEQFSTATDGQWPFYAGRFIRPDLIVSVDVVEGERF
jgi:hypothetical protein